MSKAPSNTSSAPSKPEPDSFPSPAKGDVIVFGVIERGAGGQAAWFKASEADAAVRVALMFKMACRVIATDEHALLASRLPIGELNGVTRRFAPLVNASLFGSLSAPPWDQAAKVEALSPKQPPTGWTDLQVGHIVLGQEDGEDGWWQAIIVKLSGNNATLRWRFEPELGGFVRPLSRLGIVQIAAAA